MRKRWIIGGIVLLVALSVAYTGYWFWLAQTFERNLALWIDQQKTLGYQISYEASEPSGYPFLVTIQLSDVVAEPPADMMPWRLDAASIPLSLAPWSPLNLRVGDGNPTSAARLQWNANGRNFELSMDGADTTISLSDEATPPAIKIDVQRIQLAEGDRPTAGIWKLSGQIEPSQSPSLADSPIAFSFDALQIDLHVGPQSDYKEIYDPELEGKLFGAFRAGPLREALGAWSGQGGYLDLTRISADPEGGFPPRFEGAASIALDPQLQPIIAGSITVHDYIPAIDRAVADGQMTPAQGTAAKMWLSARAENDYGKLKVTLPITIQDGFVSTGPIKLAQVPRIEWQ